MNKAMARETLLYAVLVLLLVLPMLLQVVLGSVFTYRWMDSTATVSPPVVRLADPGSPNVTVSLYNYGTAGDVYANATIDLVLEKRSAIFFDTFDTSPIGTRLIVPREPKECRDKWGYDTNAGAVSIKVNGIKAECIAYANIDVSQYAKEGRTVYVAFLVWRGTLNGPGSQTNRFDSVYFNTTRRTYYNIGWEGTLQSGRNGETVNSIIQYSASTQLNTTSLGTSYVTEENYLTYVASEVNFSSWRAIHWFNGSIQTSVTIPPTYRIYIDRVGIGYWISKGDWKGNVYFDNLVVTVDAPPWEIYVTGLPAGWEVVLKNSTGGEVSRAVADSSGVAVLDAYPPPYVDVDLNTGNPNFRDGFIFPNATIEVYDELGNLVRSKTFNEVVGGDVYRIGFSGNLLRVDSTLAGDSFEARLVLVNTNCSSVPWWLYLYLVNASNHYSTPINITKGQIYSGETSVVVMTPGSDGVAGYVYGRALVPSGYVCEVDVELRYSFSGWATYGSLKAKLLFRG
ncbi:hypothetical protein [Thermococcus gorgonarius]|uniref:DUF2341 domain-containing protein n=1 Tax=Thermococcus gorgonarius TaxID=71997 RepID=A0A2Z2M4C6_THEGO|nr:hypothetical protein [Thermococcus gorgonarius]ASJ00707.1 hypothetical protein A3K92_04060 [Thermococcus gorgonarius]